MIDTQTAISVQLLVPGVSGDSKQVTVSLYVLLGIYLRAGYFAAMLLCCYCKLDNSAHYIV
jgi:hypothetical protein